MFVYNSNAGTMQLAYPKELTDAIRVPGGIQFTTFQPIVWTLTTPTS